MGKKLLKSDLDWPDWGSNADRDRERLPSSEKELDDENEEESKF